MGTSTDICVLKQSDEWDVVLLLQDNHGAKTAEILDLLGFCHATSPEVSQALSLFNNGVILPKQTVTVFTIHTESPEIVEAISCQVEELSCWVICSSVLGKESQEIKWNDIWDKPRFLSSFKAGEGLLWCSAQSVLAAIPHQTPSSVEQRTVKFHFLSSLT